MQAEAASVFQKPMRAKSPRLTSLDKVGIRHRYPIDIKGVRTGGGIARRRKIQQGTWLMPLDYNVPQKAQQ